MAHKTSNIAQTNYKCQINTKIEIVLFAKKTRWRKSFLFFNPICQKIAEHVIERKKKKRDKFLKTKTKTKGNTQPYLLNFPKQSSRKTSRKTNITNVMKTEFNKQNTASNTANIDGNLSLLPTVRLILKTGVTLITLAFNLNKLWIHTLFQNAYFLFLFILFIYLFIFFFFFAYVCVYLLSFRLWV